VIALMVGRPLDTLYAKQVGAPGNVVLRVEGLRRAGVFEGISFEVRAGEIVGLAGLVGAGRTEVARAIFGSDRLDDGQIWLDGRPVHFDSPRAAVRAGLSYVPEDRQTHGLILPLPIAHNVTLPLLREMAWGGFLRPTRERRLAEDYGRRLHRRARSVRQPARDLSGVSAATRDPQQPRCAGHRILTVSRSPSIDRPWCHGARRGRRPRARSTGFCDAGRNRVRS
jgi:ABC-type sugar transport system ATPase subunit